MQSMGVHVEHGHGCLLDAEKEVWNRCAPWRWCLRHCCHHAQPALFGTTGSSMCAYAYICTVLSLSTQIKRRNTRAGTAANDSTATMSCRHRARPGERALPNNCLEGRRLAFEFAPFQRELVGGGGGGRSRCGGRADFPGRLSRGWPPTPTQVRVPSWADRPTPRPRLRLRRPRRPRCWGAGRA